MSDNVQLKHIALPWYRLSGYALLFAARSENKSLPCTIQLSAGFMPANGPPPSVLVTGLYFADVEATPVCNSDVTVSFVTRNTIPIIIIGTVNYRFAIHDKVQRYAYKQFLFLIIIAHNLFKRPPLWSSGQSSWYRSRGPGFDSRRYQIFCEVVGVERGPLSLVSITEELLEWKSSGSGLENRD
jgi:hypothetical protein